ncbi:hypothetical protein LVJ94_50250 [Pendulispora rubella]|uniref:NHL repeat-containing protein n=1 Tax=Pendulispora rubella TaxID=2741070 RepID=A0ABZ2L297_9BACT
MTPTRIAIAAIVACSLGAPACRDEVSLGNPRSYGPPPSLLPACPASEEFELIANVEPNGSPIRAMKADNDGIFVVTGTDGIPGSLFRVTGGSVQFLATVGVGPEAIAVGRDSVFVACSQSSQVFRVAKDGSTTLFVANQPGVHTLVAAESDNMAYWVLAGDGGAVRQYYFGSNGFNTFESALLPVSIAHDGKSLYVSRGQGPVLKGTGSFSDPTVTLPGRCDGRMLALTERDLLCVDGNAINRIPREGQRAATTRAVLPPGTIFDLVVGAGRVFFRFEPKDGYPGPPRIMSMPLVGDAAPTVIARLPGTVRFLTADACHLYVAEKNAVMRWRL